MNIIRVANYEEMSIEAGKRIVEKVRKNPNITLGLATGSTPQGVYQYLIQDHQAEGTSYKNVRTVNLDEYVGMPPADPNSYHYFMRENLFDHIDIADGNVNVPNGFAQDLDEECIRYEKVIADLGGIDLQVMGIGQNGHIGFNEPGTPFSIRTHIVTLAENTRIANSRFFASIDDVPKQAISMGIASILDSREIILLASGEQKAEAIARLLDQDISISEDFPASALKQHPNVTIIADQNALKIADHHALKYA